MGFKGTPCDAVAVLGQRGKIKEKLQELKNATSLNYEKGFLLYGENYIPIQGGANEAGIFNTYGKVNDLLHSHYTNLLPIFSWSDIAAIAQLYSGGRIQDPKAFVMGVVIASNTQYYLTIENEALFTSFIQSKISNNDGGIQDMLFTDLYGINTDNNPTQNEINFSNYIKNSGLKLLRGSSDFNNWQPIKNENGNVVNNPCR